MTTIINAAPMVQQLGVKDNSQAQLPPPVVALPSHLPLSYTYAEKGPTGQQLVTTDAVSLYGSATFDPLKTFATHQTELINIFAASGSAQIIERVVPANAGPKANFLLSIDMVADPAIPVYQRDSSGKIIRDADGDPLVVESGTDEVAGYRVKWVLTHITSGGPGTADTTSFGVATSAPGDQSVGEDDSTRYPILQFWNGSYGSGGNNAGLRLMAPTTTSESPLDTEVLNGLKAYPFRLQAIRREDANSTAEVVNTLTGSSDLDFVLKAGQLNPRTTGKISLKDVFKAAYESVGNPLRANVYADVPNVHIYTANLDTVINALFGAEKTALAALEETAGSDISETESTANKWLYNLLTFKNSGGAEYRAILPVTTGTDTVVLGASTNLFCAGGSDGTMSDSAFNTLVRAKLANYANPNHPVQDLALNPVAVMYDSGFELDTKYAMCNLLALRKDTGVILSTYTAGADNDHSEEASIGISLRARLNLYPESTYYGTSVVRGMIIARDGTLLNSNYNGKLPLTLWLAKRASEMMGSGDGVWNSAKRFDHGGRAIVDNFSNVNVNFVPAGQRVVDWANGLNYPQAYSMTQMFFPALRTAYSDDTSILTSFFAMMACIDLQKVGAQVWREYSGVVGKTRAQLTRDVENRVNELTHGRYADMFRVVPEAYITGGDEQRGFSYSLKIKMFGRGAQTVMSLTVEANREPQE